MLKMAHASEGLRGCALLLLLALSACSYNTYFIPSDSYMIGNRNHTYAIYNSEYRLMTHPLDDLALQIEMRQLRCMSKASFGRTGVSGKKFKGGGTSQPISDIYIVSHGWNYTASEAVANYHSYMELADQLANSTAAAEETSTDTSRDCSSAKSFQPFFIFITWASTTKPTSDLASAVLPFQLDDAIHPLTFAVDNGPFFLLTAWKESLNAAAIALGKGFPNNYFFNRWKSDNKQEYGTDSFYLEDKKEVAPSV